MLKRTRITTAILSITLIGSFLWLKSPEEKPSITEAIPQPTDLGQQAAGNSPPVSIAQLKAKQAEVMKVAQHEDIKENTALSPIDRIREIQHQTALHEALLEDHANYSRYPDYNRKISPEQPDPTIERYKIDERVTLDEETHTALTIWSDKKFYLHGDTVTIFASLQDENQTPLASQFMAQLIYNESKNLQQFELLDNDQNGVYSYSFTVDPDKQAGLYKVLVINQHNKLADALTFTLSKPDLELTGNYRDSLNAMGNLLIEAEISVSATNRFYFQASLYSSGNTPIGTSQYSKELNTGKHWIPLEFDGLMIRDAQEEGPYLLKNLSLAKVALPIQVAPLEQPGFYTRSYSLNQFRSSQYASNN